MSSANSNGSPDTSFGSGGTVELLALPGGPSTWQAINAVATAADGTITVAGRGFDPTFIQNFILVARLLPNGSLDPSFGGSGQVRTDLGPDVQLRSANAAAVASRPTASRSSPAQ